MGGGGAGRAGAGAGDKGDASTPGSQAADPPARIQNGAEAVIGGLAARSAPSLTSQERGRRDGGGKPLALPKALAPAVAGLARQLTPPPLVSPPAGLLRVPPDP